MQSTECLGCPNCVLNIYTYFDIDIYKLPVSRGVEFIAVIFVSFIVRE